MSPQSVACLTSWPAAGLYASDIPIPSAARVTDLALPWVPTVLTLTSALAWMTFTKGRRSLMEGSTWSCTTTPPSTRSGWFMEHHTSTDSRRSPERFGNLSELEVASDQ